MYHLKALRQITADAEDDLKTHLGETFHKMANTIKEFGMFPCTCVLEGLTLTPYDLTGSFVEYVMPVCMMLQLVTEHAQSLS